MKMKTSVELMAYSLSYKCAKKSFVNEQF